MSDENTTGGVENTILEAVANAIMAAYGADFDMGMRPSITGLRFDELVIEAGVWESTPLSGRSKRTMAWRLHLEARSALIQALNLWAAERLERPFILQFTKSALTIYDGQNVRDSFYELRTFEDQTELRPRERSDQAQRTMERSVSEMTSMLRSDERRRMTDPAAAGLLTDATKRRIDLSIKTSENAVALIQAQNEVNALLLEEAEAERSRMNSDSGRRLSLVDRAMRAAEIITEGAAKTTSH